MMAVWRQDSSPPNLQTQPWTSVYVGAQLHLVKGVFHEDGYEVACWDMRAMWVEEVGGGEMAERMKVSGDKNWPAVDSSRLLCRN